MDTSLLSEFDSFLNEISLKLNKHQLIEQENNDLKAGKALYIRSVRYFKQIF